MKKRLTLLMLVLLLVSCAPKGKEIPLDAYVHCLEQDMDFVVENVEKTGISLNQTDHFFWEAKDAVQYKKITMDLLMSFDQERTLNMYTFQYKHEDTKIVVKLQWRSMMSCWKSMENRKKEHS